MWLLPLKRDRVRFDLSTRIESTRMVLSNGSCGQKRKTAPDAKTTAIRASDQYKIFRIMLQPTRKIGHAQWEKIPTHPSGLAPQRSGSHTSVHLTMNALGKAMTIAPVQHPWYRVGSPGNTALIGGPSWQKYRRRSRWLQCSRSHRPRFLKDKAVSHRVLPMRHL